MNCFTIASWPLGCVERATHRDIGARYVAANLQPDCDAITDFRRANRAAFEAALRQVLLLAKRAACGGWEL